MAFTLRANSENTATNSTSLVITKPTGLAVGDLMVAVIGKDDDVAISTFPTGFVLAGDTATFGTITGNDVRSWVGYKVAVQADVDATNFTWTADQEDWSGTITAFQSDNGGQLVAVSAAVLRESDVTPISAAISAATSGNLLIGACVSAQADSGGLGSTTAGYTLGGNPDTGQGNGDNGSILAYDLSASGGETTYEASNAESTAESHVYILEFEDVAGDQTITPGASVSVTAGSNIITVGSVALTLTGASVTVSPEVQAITVNVTPDAVIVTVTSGSSVITTGSVAIIPDANTITVTSGAMTITISGGVDRSQAVHHESDGLFVFLYANHDFVSTEIVGALNDINSTEGIGYGEAHETYLDG